MHYQIGNLSGTEYSKTLQKISRYRRLQVIAIESLQLINFFKGNEAEVLKKCINTYFCLLSIITFLLLIRLYFLLILALQAITGLYFHH